ncbi:response regulator [Legionella waltersii]|uniref:Two component sensor and regulator histidine kinase response regulator n=1 Tax=Legionella waltersii TaxID=66969 RepID=A0A0W1A6I2_9GAMM|nr:response regulator [Legionella waltersii]KTD76611.1 two component sensor and regulator histidine kinase response regulator [Legionella waltersii]SNU94627.1 two component sensor and regulator, histidine kinase response regulator [Legionella waltersii]
MHVLIVEDNAFNAFCLRRLLESLVEPISVTIVNNSQAALAFIENQGTDVVIMDGDLGPDKDANHCNGPELAEILLNTYPNLPIVAWTDSDSMREAFSSVFIRNGSPLNEYNSWTKSIQLERICKTWAYYFGEFMASQNSAFLSTASAGAR